MKTIVIFDLDGTLALIDARREKATKPNGKLNWGVFFDPQNIQLDKPNLPVISAFSAMKSAGYTVGIFSGRDSISKTETEAWLKSNGVDYDFLHMRPQKDYTPDDVLKSGWLDELLNDGNKILCVFDDRDKVVKMWRDRGIACFQVNYGEF
jgi:hypothetical protein